MIRLNQFMFFIFFKMIITMMMFMNNNIMNIWMSIKATVTRSRMMVMDVLIIWIFDLFWRTTMCWVTVMMMMLLFTLQFWTVPKMFINIMNIWMVFMRATVRRIIITIFIVFKTIMIIMM
uniref:Uncharacterized protein n=1 Tax=Cacopsylla melanoneura TaxID=428564 RepID=A0A8D8RFM8_9HEMI